MEYLINPRDKGENEQTYQDALGLLRVNAVNESNAKIGDTILLASGVGEIAVVAKAVPVFLKGFFSTTGKTLTEKSSSLVSATRQGAAKAESRALDDTAETVVSSSSQNAVGNDTTTQVKNVVTKWGVPKNVTEKFPTGWVSKANKKGVGTRWQDPNNPGNGVRIDQGNPNHSLSSQQVDHVIVRRDGQVIGRDGNPIKGSIKDNAEQAHIPLSEYQNWKSWDSPL